MVAVVLLAGCASSAKTAQQTQSSSTSSPTTATVESQPTTSASGSRDRLHPNPELTPGATFTGVAADQVCVRGYSASVRSVSTSVRDQVFAEYGLSGATRSDFEVDHLISLELGGSNDIKNLWPQPLHDPGGNGAVDKDQLENQLHDIVCSHELALVDAQAAIVHWDTINLATLVSTTTTVAPAVPPPDPAPPATGGTVYYKDCAEARAAGAAPIHRGDPGYRAGLDRDGDGIACE
jgi:hypothetical protein